MGFPMAKSNRTQPFPASGRRLALLMLRDGLLERGAAILFLFLGEGEEVSQMVRFYNAYCN
jgi:hypothetical protein